MSNALRGCAVRVYCDKRSIGEDPRGPIRNLGGRLPVALSVPDLSVTHLSVVVPAYNEEERLPRTLARLHEYYSAQSYPYDVLVVSDGSSDSTEKLVKEFAARHPEFSVLDYSPNRGKGYAVRVGIDRAKGDLVLFCDADLATPQEETEKLLEHMRQGADVAIGSRPMKDSNLEVHQPFYREMLGRAFNKVVQVLGIRGIADTQCGFKMFTSTAAREIFGRCKLDGFGFDFEALMIARDLGLRIDEVPIRWSHQEGSKVVLMRDGPRALRDLIRLRIAGRKGRLALRETGER
jgi:dolichyl-phosphate beta-glucosyltransferase